MNDHARMNEQINNSLNNLPCNHDNPALRVNLGEQ